jgi:gliding motility-associated transport system permease protein
MRTTLLIAKRDLGAYFRTRAGWVILALAIASDAILFNTRALGGSEKLSAEVLREFFFSVSGVTLFASVAISMRLLAEEWQNGTINLLYSSPVRDVEIVVGKFLSALGFLAVMTLTTVFMPLMIMIHGKITFGQLAAGYLGLMLLGSAALAIGTLGSALARSQVVAAILSTVLLAVMVLAWTLALVSERPFPAIFNALALHGIHFSPFSYGIVHLRDVVFYLAVTYVFLFAATRVVEARRWR